MSKELTGCGNGHFYNNDEHSSCPYCGVQVNIGGGGAEVGGTRRLNEGPTDPVNPNPPGGDAGKTRAANAPRPNPNAGDGKTRIHWPNQPETEIDPVVGWLVCTTGPDRGRDYRIRNGRNFIGRDPSMDIAITGDQEISREKHAKVTYDPTSRTFSVSPGDVRGLTYLNDVSVEMATKLTEHARIRVGSTVLLFIPLCGEDFNWETEGEQAR